MDIELFRKLNYLPKQCLISKLNADEAQTLLQMNGYRNAIISLQNSIAFYSKSNHPEAIKRKLENENLLIIIKTEIEFLENLI